MQSITVKIKNVYGTDKIYPVSEQARLFADIAGTKTLTNYTIARIKKLGYAIKVEPQSSYILDGHDYVDGYNW